MKSKLLTILLGLIPSILQAQVADSIINLSVVEIKDSLTKSVYPVSSMTRNVLELNSDVDVAEILSREANVSGIKRGGYAIDPVIRGYRYSQVKVFLDNGTHIEGGCPNRMDPVMSHIEPEIIEKVDIVKGAYSLEYGTSHSACVQITTHKNDSYFIKGSKLNLLSGFESNRNLLRQHLGFRQSNGKLFYEVSGGLKTSGDYKDGNGTKWESSFKKYYISTVVGHKSSKGEELIISWRASFARDVMFPALPMDEIEDNTQIITGNYRKNFSSDPTKYINISAYHTRVYHLMDNSFRAQYNSIVPPLQGMMQSKADVNTLSSGIRAAFNNEFNGITFESGLDFNYIFKDGIREMKMIMTMDGNHYVNTSHKNLWKESVISNGGAFTTVSYSLGKYSYILGARIDLNHSHSSDTLKLSSGGENYFNNKDVNRVLASFSAGVVYQLNHRFSTTISVALSKRPPDMQERYIKFLATGFDRYDYLGDPQLKPETNYQADLIFNYVFDGSSLKVNLFASQIKDFITGIVLPPSTARPQSLGAPGVKQYSNIDKAIFTGFEISARFNQMKRSRIELSAGYTYAWFPEIEKVLLDNNNQINGITLLKNDPVAEMPALDALIQYSYNAHKLRLKPIVEIKATAPQNRVSFSYGEESTPGYLIADISLIWTPSRVFTVSGGINNIFNTAYYDHLNRRLLNKDMKLYEPGRSFFILLKVNI